MAIGLVIALGALGYWFATTADPGAAKLPFAYAVAIFLGAIVGSVEIFQRYRAEPLQALLNRWGAFYVGFNALVAGATFGVVQLAQKLGEETLSYELLQWASAAGFGSAILLRSKLLNIEMSGGKPVAIGPEIVVQTFLAIIDRELDRSRAKRRFEMVRHLFTEIDFERSKLRLPMEVFQAMQGVTEEESETLMKRIAEVDAMTTLDDQDKAYQLGFYLLDLVGEDFLAEILGRYKTAFSKPSGTPLSLPASPAVDPAPAPRAGS